MFVVSKGVSFTLGPNELLESLFTSPRLEEKEHHWLWTCSMTLGEFNMWVFSLKWWVFPNNFHGVFPIKNWCFWGGDWGKPTIFGYIHVNFQSRRESQTSNWFLHHSQWTFALRIAGIFGPGDFSSMSFVTKIEDLPPRDIITRSQVVDHLSILPSLGQRLVPSESNSSCSDQPYNPGLLAV